MTASGKPFGLMESRVADLKYKEVSASRDPAGTKVEKGLSCAAFVKARYLPIKLVQRKLVIGTFLRDAMQEVLTLHGRSH